jgi:ABC-type phosphate transport system auxiliary subunit
MPDWIAALSPYAWLTGPLVALAALALTVWLAIELRGLRQAAARGARALETVARDEPSAVGETYTLQDDPAALRAAAAVLLAMRRQETPDQGVDRDTLMRELSALVEEWDEIDHHLGQVLDRVERRRQSASGASGSAGRKGP